VRQVQTGPVIGFVCAVAALAGLAATVGLSASGWLTGLACGAATNLALARGMTRHRVSRLGPADRVTSVRAALTGGVAALAAQAFTRPIPVPALVALAAVALALDVVDGRVARRTRTVSRLGARFDMEVDALLILALSVYVARDVGAWVLAIGAARYLLGAAGWVLPWLRRPTPTRHWSKVVAAVQGVVLIVAAADRLPPALTAVALVAALILLTESFGHQVRQLWGSRPTPDAHVAELTCIGSGHRP
jgi:phosphatidylglycerophosphate synthase